MVEVVQVARNPAPFVHFVGIQVQEQIQVAVVRFAGIRVEEQIRGGGNLAVLHSLLEKGVDVAVGRREVEAGERWVSAVGAEQSCNFHSAC